MAAPAPGSPAASPPSPWFAGPLFHLLTGAIVLGAGIALLHYGQTSEALVAVGSGITFLGVGSGAAASS